MATIRAILADVKRRRAARIRRAALAEITEAREDRRSLHFPCSGHLRNMWRQGEVRARRAEDEAKANAAREKQTVLLLQAQREQASAAAQAAQQAHQAAQAVQAAQDKKAIRACLVAVRWRQTAYIRSAALAPITEARADRRALSFPCSEQLRSLWRRGMLPSRGCA